MTAWILIQLNPWVAGNPETEEQFVQRAVRHAQFRYHPISGTDGATKPLFVGVGMFVIPDTWGRQEAETFALASGMKAHAVEFSDEEYDAFITAINAGQVVGPA